MTTVDYIIYGFAIVGFICTAFWTFLGLTITLTAPKDSPHGRPNND